MLILSRQTNANHLDGHTFVFMRTPPSQAKPAHSRGLDEGRSSLASRRIHARDASIVSFSWPPSIYGYRYTSATNLPVFRVLVMWRQAYTTRGFASTCKIYRCLTRSSGVAVCWNSLILSKWKSLRSVCRPDPSTKHRWTGNLDARADNGAAQSLVVTVGSETRRAKHIEKVCEQLDFI